ncbi:hypothetical protein ACQ4LE_000304 [Meloidogyne hapla]
MDKPTTASNSLHSADGNIHSHRSHSHLHSRSATRANRQEPGVDLICKVKYSNKLPDLPFEPKFLQSPFVSLNRFVNYKPSTLEKNFKYELLTEPDLNVKIDLISTTYQIDGIDKPQLHPIDEQLLEDESIQQLNTKRSIQHRKVVPWMRKTEYISTEFNRYGLGQTGVDRPDTKIGYGTKNQLKDETFDYKDRSSQLAAIERTFEHAKKPIKRHYSRPGVIAVEEMQILPDFDLWKFPFAQVLFDADPLPYCKTHRQEKLALSILRGMADSEGNQFVGYFSPFDEALEQRLVDDKEEIGSYKDGFEYLHKLEREYNWSVQNKATKGYEQENYFMVQRGSTFYYNELETRVKLARRVKGSNISSTSKNKILSVTNRMLDSKEITQMNQRDKMLYGLQEEEEEEEEEGEQNEEKDGEVEEHEKDEEQEEEAESVADAEPTNSKEVETDEEKSNKEDDEHQEQVEQNEKKEEEDEERDEGQQQVQQAEEEEEVVATTESSEEESTTSSNSSDKDDE